MSPDYKPPTDEQLASFVAVLLFGPSPSAADRARARKAISREPSRSNWLARHREISHGHRKLAGRLGTGQRRRMGKGAQRPRQAAKAPNTDDPYGPGALLAVVLVAEEPEPVIPSGERSCSSCGRSVWVSNGTLQMPVIPRLVCTDCLPMVAAGTTPN